MWLGIRLVCRGSDNARPSQAARSGLIDWMKTMSYHRHVHHHYYHFEAREEVMRRLDTLDEKIDLTLGDTETIMATWPRWTN
jgi:hypothetical protein